MEENKCPHNTPGCFGPAGDFFGFMCSECERDGIKEHISRLRSALASNQLESGTHRYHRMRNLETANRAMDKLDEAIDAREKARTAVKKAEKDRDSWKSILDMYANAWVRELGPFRICKWHEIDSLVLSTRQLVNVVKGRAATLSDNTRINVLLTALVALQLSAGTQIYRQQCALAPILRHAQAGDKAPPLSFSVGRCGEIEEEVERA